VQLEDVGDLFQLKVDTSLKRTGQNAVLQVTAKPHLKLQDDGKPETIPRGQKLKQIAADYEKRDALMPDMVKRLKAEAGRLPPERKAFAEKQIELEEQSVKTRAAQFKKLERVLQGGGGKVPIHLRVYFQAGGSEVELLKAGQ
jgi:hypothetical protein